MGRINRRARFNLRLFKRLEGGLRRLRHFRGHGVHSPFVYTLYREVFMRRDIIPSRDLRVLQTLEENRGLRRRISIELHNIYIHCGSNSFELDPSVDSPLDCDFVVVTPHYPIDKIEKLLIEATKRGTTVAITKPHKDAQRALMCDKIIERHHCTTLYRPGYLLILNNHLPKQHFQL